MNINFILNFFSFLVFILFLIITFFEIKRKGGLSKLFFLVSLSFSFLCFLLTTYYFIISGSENIIMVLGPMLLPCCIVRLSVYFMVGQGINRDDLLCLCSISDEMFSALSLYFWTFYATMTIILLMRF